MNVYLTLPKLQFLYQYNTDINIISVTMFTINEIKHLNSFAEWATPYILVQEEAQLLLPYTISLYFSICFCLFQKDTEISYLLLSQSYSFLLLLNIYFILFICCHCNGFSKGIYDKYVFQSSFLDDKLHKIILILLYRLLSVSSVAQLCPNLWDPMNCSTQGFPINDQLPEPAQTHVHWVGDAIQPSHPLTSISLLLLPSIFPSIRSFPMS